jgi:hypothetical protein
MLLYTLFTFVTAASAISVIPGTGYLPNAVRAGCRTALAENITTCSSLLAMQPEYIEIESLNEVCTSACGASLSTMYAKALSACGTGSVNVTVNETSAILVPLDLAGELYFRYNLTCIKDKDRTQMTHSSSSRLTCVVFTRWRILQAKAPEPDSRETVLGLLHEDRAA